MKQYEPKKCGTYLEACVIEVIKWDAGSDLRFLPDTLRRGGRSMFSKSLAFAPVDDNDTIRLQVCPFCSSVTCCTKTSKSPVRDISEISSEKEKFDYTSFQVCSVVFFFFFGSYCFIIARVIQEYSRPIMSELAYIYIYIRVKIIK